MNINNHTNLLIKSNKWKKLKLLSFHLAYHILSKYKNKLTYFRRTNLILASGGAYKTMKSNYSNERDLINLFWIPNFYEVENHTR